MLILNEFRVVWIFRFEDMLRVKLSCAFKLTSCLEPPLTFSWLVTGHFSMYFMHNSSVLYKGNVFMPGHLFSSFAKSRCEFPSIESKISSNRDFDLKVNKCTYKLLMILQLLKTFIFNK